MNITAGNQYVKVGDIKKAISEYQKIKPDSPLYKSAQFNIEMLTNGIYTKGLTSVYSAKVVDKPLVSIIMPVFNVASYLDASILSVLDQSYKNIELIIVNDASTDNGINIINMYKNQDRRVKVIDLEFNTLGGAGIPSNIGVDNAIGEYIAYADSDDILDRFAIERMLEEATSKQVDVVIADLCNFNDDTREVETAYDKHSWKTLPINEAFSPQEYPQVFRLSPVPWRKLYRRSFLEHFEIRFPEGDYFYEDNPLHWFVLSRAKDIVLLDYVVAYHRMAREGQTMGANNYKLSAQFCHLNTILQDFVTHRDRLPDVYWKELVDFSYRSGWVIDRQVTIENKKLLQKRYAQVATDIVKASKLTQEDVLKLRPNYYKKLEEFSKSKEAVDLTIVIPVYNCQDLLEETLQSLTTLKSLKIEVFLMDDGSSDISKDICEKYADKYDYIYSYSQGNRGAGVARNALIPLITGEYTYFLDADDTFEKSSLKEAFHVATQNQNDLLFFKYKIDFYEQKRSRDMFNADAEIWKKLLTSHTNREKQILASGLINYPWNRIIKTSLLHNENIFFGKTVVHNDVPYHWHSIASAKNIGLLDKVVCHHRKFDDREQITNISDARRMMVFDAYRHTRQIISSYESFESLFPNLKLFTTNLLMWAKDRVPSELKGKFSQKQKDILKELEG